MATTIRSNVDSKVEPGNAGPIEANAPVPTAICQQSGNPLNSEKAERQEARKDCSYCGSCCHLYVAEGSCPKENRQLLLKSANVAGCIYCGGKDHSFYEPADCPTYMRVMNPPLIMPVHCLFCGAPDHTVVNCARELSASAGLRKMLRSVEASVERLKNLAIAPHLGKSPTSCRYCGSEEHHPTKADNCPNYVHFMDIRNSNRNGCAYCHSTEHILCYHDDCPILVAVDEAILHPDPMKNCSFCEGKHEILNCRLEKEARSRCRSLVNKPKYPPKPSTPSSNSNSDEIPKPKSPKAISKPRLAKSGDNAINAAFTDLNAQLNGAKDAIKEMKLEHAEEEAARLDNARGLALLNQQEPEEEVEAEDPSVQERVQKNIDKLRVQIQSTTATIAEVEDHNEFEVEAAYNQANLKRYYLDVTPTSPPNSLMYRWEDNLLCVGAGIVAASMTLPVTWAISHYVHHFIQFSGLLFKAGNRILKIMHLKPPGLFDHPFQIPFEKEFHNSRYDKMIDCLSAPLSWPMRYAMRSMKPHTPERLKSSVNYVPWLSKLLFSASVFIPTVIFAAHKIRSLLPMRYKATVRTFRIEACENNIPDIDVRPELSSLAEIKQADSIGMHFNSTDTAVYYADCTRQLDWRARIKAFAGAIAARLLGIKLTSRVPDTPDIPQFVRDWNPLVPCVCDQYNLDCDCGPILRTQATDLGNPQECKFSYELVAQVLGGRGHDSTRNFSEYCEDFRSIASRMHTLNLHKYENVDSAMVRNSAFVAAVIATDSQKRSKRMFPVNAICV
jgi:hypothetical protein